MNNMKKVVLGFVFASAALLGRAYHPDARIIELWGTFYPGNGVTYSWTVDWNYNDPVAAALATIGNYSDVHYWECGDYGMNLMLTERVDNTTGEILDTFWANCPSDPSYGVPPDSTIPSYDIYAGYNLVRQQEALSPEVDPLAGYNISTSQGVYLMIMDSYYSGDMVYIKARDGTWIEITPGGTVKYHNRYPIFLGPK